ncbi:hypothetical protein [Chitinophaga rhizophila]|uniref:Immunity protein 10 of polymorphic toxin system n=1 Tax=Chitinophaga rhizophila TaxID=2866212 RepID=A0ABS7GAI1_9BACT|nr:hypothetical protein [Chitinophaga rhizophila]MBW8684361.1 hypothetical protein [Chitinophaga rhizophila]
MSYDYFLQAHLHSGSEMIATEKILAIFEIYVVAKDSSYIDLRFDDDSTCTIYMDIDAPYNDGLVVNRPCSGQLAECLYQVMQLGNFVFFEPDGIHMIIIDAAVEQHLPEDMIDTLGKPVVADTFDSFLGLYNNNR